MTQPSVTEVVPVAAYSWSNESGHLRATHQRAVAAIAALEAAALRLREQPDDVEMVYRQLGRSWSRLGRTLAVAKRERLRDRIRVVESDRIRVVESDRIRIVERDHV
jgi:hypothetical protein